MFASWGTIVSRLRWVVLVAAIAFIAFAGVWGTTVFSRLSGSSSLDDPHSQSQLISQQVINDFGNQSTDVIALYSSNTQQVTDPAFRAAVNDVTAKVRAFSSVAQVTSYYETPAPSLVSKDGHSTYLAIRFVSGASDGSVQKVRKVLRADDGLTTQVGGQRIVDLDINDQISSDIPFAEEIAMPVLVVLLLFVFGNLVAALMPVLIAAFSVLGSFLALRVITDFTQVSIFSINIITILGLGLAVDYGLFMVGRFREELDKGQPVPVAVSRTLATAGRTVAVSGLLVSLSMVSLLLYPQVLLRSMGFGGAAAVFIAMLASLTVLPAMLAILGHRIDSLRLPWSKRKRGLPSVTGLVADGAGRWGRIAASVMRRPVLYIVGVVVVLGVLALPFVNVRFGGIDERMLPAGTPSRVVSEKLAADFTDGSVRPVRVLVQGVSKDQAKTVEDQVDAVPGVTSSSISAQNDRATLLTVQYNGDASSTAARTIVKRIRSFTAPPGATIMVGGSSASVVDQLTSLSSRLPWMALIVAGVTFVLLAIAFGSILVPIKAIIMNLISIACALGAVTWVFQDGHLSGLLHFTPTGYVEASQPVLMVAILFGLSMDYEVFLLSRIRERWDDLGDNTAAVAAGVQRTGGLITTAAVLLAVVVGAFSTSGITFIKMIGVGMVVALLVDATLVRLLLVPATMRLLGGANWWAPAFLRRLYGRYGHREDEPVTPQAEDEQEPVALATS